MKKKDYFTLKIFIHHKNLQNVIKEIMYANNVADIT